MTENHFMNKCKESGCDYIYKGVTATIDERVKYWIYGIKNGYITETLPVIYYGQYTMFDKLDYRKYYGTDNLMKGEQLTLL